MKRLVAALFFVTTLCAATDAFALFDLTVTPRRGGQHLRFEEASPGSPLRNEEVTVSVSSDLGVSYRILQTVYEPLTNETGAVLPQNAFMMFSPSDPLGSLRTEIETPVRIGQFPLYTSNASGESDSFILAYHLSIPENQSGGTYHTRLSFTAEPVNAQSGVSQKTVTLDVRVEIRPSFQFTVVVARGGRTLDFGGISKNRPSAEETLRCRVESNTGSGYRVTQEMIEPLLSSQGEVLPEEALQFSVNEAGDWRTLSASQPLFSSSDGRSETFDLRYALKPEGTQKAGVYNGNLTLRLESDSGQFPPQTVNVRVKAEIDVMFDLEIKPDQGGASIHFGTFKGGSEKQERRIRMKVHTNLSEPYQITQNLSRKLTNPEGAAIPEGYFLFYGAEAGKGKLAATQPSPVEEGESVIYTSDSRGAPDDFLLSYSLAVPEDARAGAYNAELTYSIVAL